jgi:hypothetical protein
MSVESRTANRRLKRIGPVGRMSALLTASGVWVIGAICGLEPHVILWRSLIAALLVGAIVTFGLSVILMANTKR